MDTSKLAGHISCFSAYLIFGVNIVICKDISNSTFISPLELFTLRAIGASILFWLASVILPGPRAEKMAISDLPRVFVASMLGLFLTQVSFLFACKCTTPVDISLMGTLSPIATMFIAAVALKEPITAKKALGVAISFIGVICLILNSTHAASAIDHTTPAGWALMFVNMFSFALYLGIFRPFIRKYSAITFMKWMFLFSAIVSIPFTARGLFTEVPYSQIPTAYYLELSYLIVMATFVAYFLVPVGQKRLRPTVVSLYNYLQPIIAIAIAISVGMDSMSWPKALAAAAVVGGAVLVNFSRAASH